MDPFMRLLIMMRRLAQRRLSRREYLLLTGVLVFALALGLFEYVFGWPEWLRANPPGIHRQPVLQ